jgi:hypothetical protein
MELVFSATGRNARPWRAAAVGLGLLPVLLVLIWTGWSYLTDLNGFLCFYERFSNPGHGVSLLPTAAFMTLGAVVALHFRFLLGLHTHPDLYPHPYHWGEAKPVQDPDVLAIQRARELAGPKRSRVLCLLLGLLALMACQSAKAGGLIRPVLDGRLSTNLVLFVGWCLFFSSFDLFRRFVLAWIQLKGILRRLEACTGHPCGRSGVPSIPSGPRAARGSSTRN